MLATTSFLESQVAALQETLDRKESYVIRLQDEVSSKTQLISTIRAEQNNLANAVKEFVLESVKNDDMSMSVAESLAELCDFELSKTITITATVDFELEITVPFDADADDVIAAVDFSADAYDYSIDDFSYSTRNVDWEDTIS